MEKFILENVWRILVIFLLIINLLILAQEEVLINGLAIIALSFALKEDLEF